MADLERLMKTESATTTEKKRSSTNLLPFLVKGTAALQSSRKKQKTTNSKENKISTEAVTMLLTLSTDDTFRTPIFISVGY